MGLRKKWQLYKGKWLERHTTIDKLVKAEIWFKFHLTRGMSFYDTYLAIIKFIIYLLAGTYFLQETTGIKTETDLMQLSYLLVTAIALLFIATSQAMDLIRYQQRQEEENYKRQPIVQELRKKLIYKEDTHPKKPKTTRSKKN